jgi:hypothetical protein
MATSVRLGPRRKNAFVQHEGRTINQHIRAVDIIRAAQPSRKNMLGHGMTFLFRSRGVL